MVVNFKIFVDTFAKNKTVIKFRKYKSIGMIDFLNHLLTNYEKNAAC